MAGARPQCFRGTDAAQQLDEAGISPHAWSLSFVEATLQERQRSAPLSADFVRRDASMLYNVVV